MRWLEKNGGSAVGNEKYPLFPNCKKIRDLGSLENYDEIYVH